MACLPANHTARREAEPAPLCRSGGRRLEVAEGALVEILVALPRLLAEVADKIKRKIGWPAEQWEVAPRPFLTAFYRAQGGGWSSGCSSGSGGSGRRGRGSRSFLDYNP